MKSLGRRVFVLGAVLPSVPVSGAFAATEPPLTFADEKSFAGALAVATTPLVIDLWATWCGPCKRFAPVFDAVAASGKYPGTSFARLDVGPTNGPLWQSASNKYGFKFIPAVLLFAPGGRFVATASGGVSNWSEWKLRDWLSWKLPEARKS
jgi:thiol-disulfide isomerase/thioredoxin